ncbi:PP2C family protein-serine/threonine phosphatase [Ammoniphilus resinae]|uniref:Serine phosphatase RsbU (Regulator of sigma subunit) n=1 Tax=Ammoniphilus resinae TaxID=861532 RepID=A0ABS4GT87_9BACL|nr:PP2C family protein-serine/threonine phosphatase [Ammoniphilus resinae]MBP1933497.1 serine phosphatase RsbU (regulator of sigma subunit) [Ammoniphilus resinae]
MKFSKLFVPLFFLYLGIALFGALIITLGNLYINGSTIAKLLKYNLKAIAVQVLFLLVLFQIFSLVRLKTIWKPKHSEQVKDSLIWQRLLYFPSETFWSMVIFGLLAGPLFHIFDLLLRRRSIAMLTQWEWLSQIKSFFYEQAIVLMLAILLYTFIRRLLRPYILQLPVETMKEMKPRTLVYHFAIIFSSLFLVSLFSILWYIFNRSLQGKSIDLWVLLAITGFITLFSCSIFTVHVLEFRREIRIFIDRIYSLLNSERKSIHAKIPVMSRDETGQLSLVFNRLQERIQHEYEDIERDLQLANAVQQKLLPSPYATFEHFQVAASFQPYKEIGGDFYDLIQFSPQRFAFVIGDVSGKGMPAALVMSATLVLLRTEIKRGGTPAEILERVNKELEEIVQGEMFVTLGLGMIDTQNKNLRYASAGHLAPYLVRNGQPQPLKVSSLPLGIDPDEIYREEEVSLLDGDTLVLYTDGLIENFSLKDYSTGFDALESWIKQWDPGLSIEDKLQLLLAQRALMQSQGTEDDCTVLLIGCGKVVKTNEHPKPIW